MLRPIRILWKRIYEEGHLIGNHTYHHVEITKLSDEEAMYEINKTDELIAAITGQRVQYIRPPFGGLAENWRIIWTYYLSCGR